MNRETRLLNAVHIAARKLASSQDINQMLRDVLSSCIEAVGAQGGTVYLHDKAKRTLKFRHVLPEEVLERIQLSDIPDDFGVAGKVFQSRNHEISVFEPGDESRKAIEEKVGIRTRTMITVPLMMENEEPIGVVQLVDKLDGNFTEEDAMVLDTVSAISTLSFLNSQLLDDSTRASQLLGMGKVSHDIKNLAFALEANLSFSNMTIQGLRADVEEGQTDRETLIGYVDGIEAMFEELNLSIDRIKRYSTLMSDLSAGKALKPDRKLAPLATTIELSAAYLESEGRSNNVRLVYDIQQDAPGLLHDEMYLFRIVQNLVSNAIKAVSEKERRKGEESVVTVRYRFNGDYHVLEVQDEGPGMSPETARQILSGNARSVWSKNTGSGWGTKIVLELAATHQAIVEIDSEIGQGSTFRLSFPHVAEPQA